MPNYMFVSQEQVDLRAVLWRTCSRGHRSPARFTHQDKGVNPFSIGVGQRLSAIEVERYVRHIMPARMHHNAVAYLKSCAGIARRGE